jgi:hypothetical protein
MTRWARFTALARRSRKSARCCDWPRRRSALGATSRERAPALALARARRKPRNRSSAVGTQWAGGPLSGTDPGGHRRTCSAAPAGRARSRPTRTARGRRAAGGDQGSEAACHEPRRAADQAGRLGGDRRRSRARLPARAVTATIWRCWRWRCARSATTYRRISPPDLTPLHGVIEHRSAELRSQTFGLGERLYAERPKSFAKRMHRYWRAWRGSLTAQARQHPSDLAEAARRPAPRF